MNNRFFKYIKITFLLFPVTLLVSCDAMLLMTYTVENKTKSDVKVFVPNFPTDSIARLFGHVQDTTLVIKPDEEVVVGLRSKIDFPWGTRNIYKNQPGICGIKRFQNDTHIDLGCTKREWKYKRRNSKLKLKSDH